MTQHIKLSHLRVFAEVADAGSISVAAERLFRSPSAISMMMSNLESQLNKPLFESDGKSRLTPFGQFVFESAKQQLDQYDRSVNAILAFANNELGRVEISSVPSFALAFLPQLLKLYRTHYSGVDIAIRDGSTRQIHQQLISGKTDIGITGPPQNERDVVFTALLTDDMGIVCRNDHPLSQIESPLEWKDVANFPFIVNGTCRHIQSESFRKIVAAAEMEVENTTSLLAMVGAGLGITTLPALAVPKDNDTLIFKSMADSNLSRLIGISLPAKRTPTPAADAFRRLIIEHFQFDTSANATTSATKTHL
ncbi:MAG: LysR family transcriptional regulator [Pseudomonadota bacterium]